jgi:ATP-dependent Clp endopeptidase proteolytic subunit ClpP
MLIDDQIGVDENGVGIDGNEFARELLQLDSSGKKRIQVWINSPGGSVVDGMAIYNAINATKTKVDTRCIGMAASIAGVIFQAGRKREMNDYGILMYHNPYDITDEASKDPMIEVMRKSIITMIESKSGMSVDDVEAMMSDTTFLTADEAFAKGLCDVIINSEDLNVPRRMPAKTDVVGVYKVSKNIYNKFLTPVHTMAFPKVANRLQLNESASEDAIVSAIDALQNKIEAAAVVNKKTKDELDKMKNDLDDAENKFKDLQDKFDAANKELTDAKDAAMTEKCQNMVKGYATQGRIKNEQKVIDRYVNLAKADFAGTEELIKDLPLNKDSVRISNASNEVAATAPVYNMALQMVNITNKVNSKK